MHPDDLKSQPLDRLESLRFRCARCTSCNLHRNRKTSIDGVGGSEKPEVLIVVDRTSVKTSTSGNIFDGREGSIMNNLIRLSKIDPSRLWVSPAVSCPVEKSVPGVRGKEIFGAPKAAAVKACRWRLHEEIRILNPYMLVAMGPSSVDALRIKGTFTGTQGRVVEAQIEGEVNDYMLPTMVIDSVMTLLRTAQNPRKIWNKNISSLRLAAQISKQLKELSDER